MLNKSLKVFFISVFIFIFFVPLMAEMTSDGLSVYLRIDRTEYKTGEDIILKVYVKNKSFKNNAFYIYDDNRGGSYTTFQPVVKNLTGREPALKVPYILEGRDAFSQVKKLKKRKIELLHGEEFVYTMNIKKIYQLISGEEYRMRCYFFPVFSERNYIKSENELFFRISQAPLFKVEKKYRKLETERYVSPSEIVLLALHAEANNKWELVFKYIDLDKYIVSFPDYQKDYLRVSRFERKAVIKNFKKFLMRRRVDVLLEYIIKDEMIEKNGKIAYVDVMVERYGARITDTYKYKYTLKKKENRWYIVKLDATVMRGKKR